MKPRIFSFLILGILFFLNILAWIGVYDLTGPHFLEVIFFAVGQGDAIFIETPQRHQILIDGGPSAVILEKLAKEMPFWDRSIDLIILTHPDFDHLQGLLEVLERYRVEKILWTGIIKETPAYHQWLKLIEEEKAAIFIAQAGQRISANSKFKMLILNPFESLEGKRVRNVNNTSIVAKLNFGQNSFLFTGDIFRSIEKKLLDKKLDINCDILKVAHHGSRTSNSEEFLKETSPELAIIQVGENRYGHPHQEVLERMKKFGIKILRTDQDGDIKIISDGLNYKIK